MFIISDIYLDFLLSNREFRLDLYLFLSYQLLSVQSLSIKYQQSTYFLKSLFRILRSSYS